MHSHIWIPVESTWCRHLPIKYTEGRVNGSSLHKDGNDEEDDVQNEKVDAIGSSHLEAWEWHDDDRGHQTDEQESCQDQFLQGQQQLQR